MIPDSLQTIAEISIGLAGFSGLIVALRKSSGPLTVVQKFRLQVLFALTFSAMFLALLPDLLTGFALPEALAWPIASAVMFVCSFVVATWLIAGARRIAKLAPEIFNWIILYSLAIGGHGAVLLLQAGVMTGLITSRAPGAFMLGLLWYLMHAAYQFVRMLLILPRGAEHG